MDKIVKYSKVITALLNVFLLPIKTEVIVVLLLFIGLTIIN